MAALARVERIRYPLPVFLEDGLRIPVGALERADRRIIVVAAEKIVGLGAHDHLDGGRVGHGVFLGDQRGYFVEVFFVGLF